MKITSRPFAAISSSYLRRLLTAWLTVFVILISRQAQADVSYNLVSGWNLLGNPTDQAINVLTSFGDAAKITSVWKWNKTTSKWAFYAPSMTPDALTTYAQAEGYEVLSDIAPKEGFWVNTSRAVTLIGPAGNGVTLVVSDLQPGWNLVGSADNSTPLQMSQGLSSSLNAAGEGIESVWAWDVSNAKWKFYAPSLDAQGGTVLADYIANNGYLPFSNALSASDGFWLKTAAGKTPMAAVATPSTAKVPWSLATTSQFLLKDSSGAIVVGSLTCSSDSPATLTVAADCSSITGNRLGNQTVTVSAGGMSAKAMVKVIPQPQALASHGAASSYGSGQYNLVVTTGGRVLAWGANPSGVLGQGKSATVLVNLSLPTAVKDSSGSAELKGIVAASAGDLSALALTEDGEVYSWGSNSYNQLGRTAINGDPLPGKVVDPSGNSTLQHIVAISIGSSNAIALADDGAIYSWGYYSGGGGTRVPGTVSAVSGGGVLGKAVAVSAGWNWSSALLADGRVVTWGFDNSTLPSYVLAQSSGQPLSDAVAISAGYLFGMALNGSGQIFAWGHNDEGQLGQDDRVSPYPNAILVKAPGGASTLSGITMVAAGGIHALALDSSGNVYSWGYSQHGQLGDGANHPRVNESPLPDAVVSTAGTAQLGGVSALAAGYGHSLALTSDGSLLIWGQGFRGNLGQGSANENDSYVPLVVKNEAGSASLSLGSMSYWPSIRQRGL